MEIKFIVFTRGRTGSTAIIDELNDINSIMTAQELFIKRDFSKKNRLSNRHYPFIPPYYLWKLHASLLERMRMWLINEEKIISHYLNAAEKLADKKGVAVFGFKALSHHFAQTPSLLTNLIQRRYRVVYLTRHVARQVISGMIAKQRGKYNSKDNYHDGRRYEIDIKEFKNLLRWEEQGVKNDLTLLKRNGFQFVVVSYEDYLNKREAFFDNMLNFLNVTVEIPSPSSYSIMIKDPKYTIENYQEVVDCLENMGMSIQ